MGRVSLTASMIVRDEEAVLDDCLASIRPIVDDIVIADTGSSDDTKAIARRHGATLFDLPWQDDFSAARNAVLERSPGDWILCIDADERARDIDRPRLERYLIDDTVVGYYIPRCPMAGYTSYWECRLFRNDPRIRFERLIFEKVGPALERVAAADGRSIGRCPLRLDHIGYDGPQLAKHRRNLPLLIEQQRRTPGDVYNDCHIGWIKADTGDAEGAVNAWTRAVEQVRRDNSVDIRDSLPFTSLIRWHAERDEPYAELLDDGLQRFPGNLELQWMHGRALMDAGKFGEAMPIFERLAAIDAVSLVSDHISYDQRIFGALSYGAVGLCCLRLGRPEESASWLARAAAADREDTT
jgi:hypothetical protein